MFTRFILFVRTIYLLIPFTTFFVVSGYLYNEKSSDKPWEYIGTRLKSYLKAYVVYGTILVLIHNILYHMKLFAPSYIEYGFRDFVTAFFNTFVFFSNEPFSAAMWFIPVLFVSLVIFNFIFAFSKRFKLTETQEKVRFLLVLLLTIFGIYLNLNNIELMWHSQTCFVVLPFLFVGNLIKRENLKWLKPNFMFSVIFVLFAFLCLHFFDGCVDLSKNDLWIPYLFYICSFMMIYVVYTISSICQSKTAIKKTLSFIGQNTLPIMCFHILVFKLMDFIIITLISKNYSILSNFTVSYPQMFILYTIVAICGSILIDLILKRIFDISKKFIKRYSNISFCRNDGVIY